MVAQRRSVFPRNDGELPGGQCCAPRRRPGLAINYRNHIWSAGPSIAVVPTRSRAHSGCGPVRDISAGFGGEGNWCNIQARTANGMR
jgi:hypothetical protein